MAKALRADLAHRLEDILNIGKSIAGDLRSIGIHAPAGLKEMNPYHAYELLCVSTGVRHDPCVLDTFLAAHDFMNGGTPKPWWEFTPKRKSLTGK